MKANSVIGLLVLFVVGQCAADEISFTCTSTMGKRPFMVRIDIPKKTLFLDDGEYGDFQATATEVSAVRKYDKGTSYFSLNRHTLAFDYGFARRGTNDLAPDAGVCEKSSAQF